MQPITNQASDVHFPAPQSILAAAFITHCRRVMNAAATYHTSANSLCSFGGGGDDGAGGDDGGGGDDGDGVGDGGGNGGVGGDSGGGGVGVGGGDGGGSVGVGGGDGGRLAMTVKKSMSKWENDEYCNHKPS